MEKQPLMSVLACFCLVSIRRQLNFFFEGPGFQSFRRRSMVIHSMSARAVVGIKALGTNIVLMIVSCLY